MTALKSVLLGAAAFCLAGAAQASGLSGDVEISYRYGDIDNNNGNDFENGQVRELAVAGRIGLPVWQSIYLQADAFHETGIDDYDVTPFREGPHSRYSLGLHAGYRNEDFYVGAFYNYQMAERINLSSFLIMEFDTVGVEGQFHFDSVSLSWQAGRSQERNDMISTWHEITFLRVGGAYYFDKDLRLSAFVLAADGEVEGADQAPLWHYAFEGRKRFGSFPVALFVRYERGDFRNETEVPNDVLEDNVFSIGLAYQFGDSSSLQEFERSAASLSSPNNLLRYMGYSADYD